MKSKRKFTLSLALCFAIITSSVLMVSAAVIDASELAGYQISLQLSPTAGDAYTAYGAPNPDTAVYAYDLNGNGTSSRGVNSAHISSPGGKFVRAVSVHWIGNSNSATLRATL